MNMRDIIALIENETPTTVSLWHGGKDLEYNYRDIKSHEKGRWEYGPGLYLTNKRDTAEKYAKGSRKVYRVTIEKGTDIEDVTISIEDIIEFVNKYVKVSKRLSIISDLNNNNRRTDAKGMIRAQILVNLCLNYEAIPNSRTNLLRQFLIDHGVDYSKETRFGGRNETVVVVINPRIITKVVAERNSIEREVPFDFGS